MSTIEDPDAEVAVLVVEIGQIAVLRMGLEVDLALAFVVSVLDIDSEQVIMENNKHFADGR